MASNNTRKSSSSSYADSGISDSSIARTVNPRYACYWIDSCQGQHEFDDCHDRRNQLCGKLGIYYSPHAEYRLFDYDEMNNKPLKSNPTGCTMIFLLIYKIENNTIWLLFVTKLLKQKRKKNDKESIRESLLALPSSNPYKKQEDPKEIALRALQTVTYRQEILKDHQSRLQRFLFFDAGSIYPFYLTPEEAKILTRNFSPNDEVQSLHWFPLADVIAQLPAWSNYLTKEEDNRGLAQIRHDVHTNVRLQRDIDGKEFTLWSVTATILLCIRNYVGFEEFLKNHDH